MEREQFERYVALAIEKSFNLLTFTEEERHEMKMLEAEMRREYGELMQRNMTYKAGLVADFIGKHAKRHDWCDEDFGVSAGEIYTRAFGW